MQSTANASPGNFLTMTRGAKPRPHLLMPGPHPQTDVRPENGTDPLCQQNDTPERFGVSCVDCLLMYFLVVRLSKKATLSSLGTA